MSTEWHLAWRRLHRASRCLACADRSGLEITLHHPAHPQAIGQAWPLPGWSVESCLDLERLIHSWPVSGSLEEWHAHSQQPQVPASLAWALSVAVAEANQQIEAPPAQIRSARLLHGSASQVQKQLIELQQQWPDSSDPPTLKVKVAGWSPEALLACCQWLEAHWPHCQLRVDANRQWSIAQVRRVAKQTRCIAYWEEPCSPAENRLLAEQGTPLALDESLREQSAEALHPLAVAWIVKPTLWGSLASLQQLKARAKAAGKPLIWSSCFEGSLTLRQMASLADPDQVHGFDPYWHHQPDEASGTTGSMERMGSRLLFS